MQAVEKKHPDRVRKIAGKAINQYELIRENDHILVAVSGGRDSMVLLDILSERLSFLPITYKLTAIHIIVEDMPVRTDIDYLKGFCQNRNIELLTERIKSGIEVIQDKSPCFVCSWNKRKKIFDIAGKLKCNKVAFGHHMDDAIETLLMNMAYHGEISSIPPKIEMFRGEFELIRPMIGITDEDVKKYANILGIKDVEGDCKHDVKNKREIFRNIVNQLSENNKNARINLFRSMGKIAFDYILPVSDNSKNHRRD